MRHLIAFLLILGSVAALGQEHLLSLSVGFATASGNSFRSATTSNKMSVNYDFHPSGKNWTIGGVVSIIQLEGKVTSGTYRMFSTPICVVGKYVVGSDKLNAFARVALGTHFSSGGYSYTATPLEDTSSFGMALGFGAGINFWISDKNFLTADYEYLLLSHALSDAGGISSLSAGFGWRF